MKAIAIPPGAMTGTHAPADPHARLRKLSHELEAVFLDQLFKAMRESVPDQGILTSSPGQEMFTSLLDQRLSSLAAERMKRGMGEALYHQLSRRLAPEASAMPEKTR